MRSRPEDAAAPRRTRVFVLWLLSLATIGIAGSTLPAGSSPARAATPTSEVTVVRAGYGDIRVEGAGGKLVLTCTSELDEKDEKIGCTFSVPTGTTLTFRAIPRPVEAIGGASSPAPTVQSEFRGWSRPECKARGTTADLHDQGQCRSGVGRRAVLARLARGPRQRGGHGRRRRQPPDVRRLRVPAGHGSVQARRTGDGDRPPDHGGGDHPLGLRLRPLREQSRQRSLRRPHLGFEELRQRFLRRLRPAPRPPFNQVVHLKVERAGNGKGQVEGSGKSAGLDDPPWSIELRRRLRFRPSPVPDPGAAAGSRRLPAPSSSSWAGPPCLSEDTCTFTVGRYPKVVAMFKKTSDFKAGVLAAKATGTGRRVRSSSSSGRTPPPARTCGCCETGSRSARRASTLPRVRAFRTGAAGVKPGWTALAIEVVGAAGKKRTFRKWLQLGAYKPTRQTQPPKRSLQDRPRGLRAGVLASLGKNHPARGRVAQQVRAVAPGATPEPARDRRARVSAPRRRDPDPERQAGDRHPRCVALDRREDALRLGRPCGPRRRARRPTERKRRRADDRITARLAHQASLTAAGNLTPSRAGAPGATGARRRTGASLPETEGCHYLLPHAVSAPHPTKGAAHAAGTSSPARGPKPPGRRSSTAEPRAAGAHVPTAAVSAQRRGQGKTPSVHGPDVLAYKRALARAGRYCRGIPRAGTTRTPTRSPTGRAP